MSEIEFVRSIAYHCHPETTWTVQKEGLFLVRRDTGESIIVNYPEAALWDLVSRQVPIHRVMKMMTFVNHADLDTVRSWIVKTIEIWMHEGWLIAKGDDG
jgi:hypothetical protein